MYHQETKPHGDVIVLGYRSVELLEERTLEGNITVGYPKFRLQTSQIQQV